MRLRRPARRRKTLQEIDPACRLAPAGARTVVRGDHNQVYRLAVFDRIMNQMRMAVEPKMNQGLAELGRNLCRREERPPSGTVGKKWLRFARDARPRRGPEPIGRDQR